MGLIDFDQLCEKSVKIGNYRKLWIPSGNHSCILMTAADGMQPTNSEASEVMGFNGFHEVSEVNNEIVKRFLNSNNPLVS